VTPMVKVSVIIKTLNEEASISRAIATALEALTQLGGEVIVADSGSTDRTVEKALSFPILLVQLGNPRERCCGIGPQLGFQHSSGKYIYVLDGDMELDSKFLQQAVDLLDSDSSLAGVGGIVREMRFENLEFENRARHFLRCAVKDCADVNCLNGGGLYRREAIEAVSYLSDRNLHGFEEYDVGVRLRAKGWRLVRLDSHAVDHYSYALGTYQLLWYRMRAGRLLSLGEILRAAVVGQYLKKALLELRPIRFALGTLICWPLVGLLALAVPWAWWGIATIAVAAALPVTVMSVRSGSVKAGAYAVAVWHLTAVNLLIGLLRTRKEPGELIASRVLRTVQQAGLSQPETSKLHA
jgi:glycosyltransferase involved in cell wall biosynthesis